MKDRDDNTQQEKATWKDRNSQINSFIFPQKRESNITMSKKRIRCFKDFRKQTKIKSILGIESMIPGRTIFNRRVRN